MTSKNRTAASPNRPGRSDDQPTLPLSGRMMAAARNLARARSLTRLAGTAPTSWLETLENRVLMAGDHPSLANFPTADPITLNASGAGSVGGIIETSGSDDLVKFTAPVTGFVKVTATADRSDPFNVLDSRIEIYTGTSSPSLAFAGSSFLERPDGNTSVPDRVNSDGVVGFFATAGTTYYVRVLSDLPSGTGATGRYTVVVTAKDNGADGTTATAVALNGGTGIGSSAGTIVANDYDLYQFVAPANDFVTVRADTLNGTASTLDSSVEVYDSVTGSLVSAGAGNGVLTGGISGGSSSRNPTDGWAGFVGVSGRTYYARVLATPTLASGKTATGAYTLRVDGKTTVIANPAVATNGTIGSGGAVLGDEIVYQFTTGSASTFDSIFFANATIPSGNLDTRLEIYDSTGKTLTADSPSGFLSNAFAAWKGNPSSTYFVRVRADEFVDATPGNPSDAQPYWGPFSLVLTTGSTAITVDPVTRRGFGGGGAGATGTVLFDFTAQGTGQAIITNVGTGLVPLADGSIHLYDSTGTELAFNDDYIGLDSQLNVVLTGGQRYWILIEGFDIANAGAFALSIESNHTFSATPDPIDDHADAGQWRDSTPIVFDYNHTVQMPDYVNGGTLTDRERVIRGTANGRITPGGDIDLFTFTPPVDMLSDYAGKITPGVAPLPDAWQAFKRAGNKVTFYLQSEEGFLFNASVTVYDSRFNQVYQNGGGVFAGLPPFPESALAGANDASAYPPNMQLFQPYPFVPTTGSFQVWGGEQYYMSVAGSAEGRYTLVMFLNGMPWPISDANFDGTSDPGDTDGIYYDSRDPNNQFNVGEETNAGSWSSAIKLVTSSLGVATSGGGAIGTFAPGAQYQRQYLVNGAPGSPFSFDPFGAGAGVYRIEDGGLSGIQHPLDTDLFFFTAPATGYAEIRLVTTNLNDTYTEFQSDGEADPLNPVSSTGTKSKNYDSPLDGALRIFSNDFTQLAYNNDNPAITGDTQITTAGFRPVTGGVEQFTFQRRDPRAVIQIVQGQTYFIQVESGQRDAYNAYQADKTKPVDWTHIIGSYQVLLQSVATIALSQSTDDFSNVTDSRFFATPIGINTDTNIDGSPTANNGTGTINGVIKNTVTPSNPSDTDMFYFMSPVRGNATIKVERQVGSTLSATFTIFDDNGNAIGTAAADATGTALLSIPTAPGERFYISVGGGGGSQGAYKLTVSGLTWSDDYADETQWQNAKQIPLADFQGTGTASGRLEGAGDTDVFWVLAPANTVLTLDVTTSAATMDPYVTVYEMGLDGRLFTDGLAQSNAVPLRIAYNDNGSGGTKNSHTIFSVNPARVSGADPEGTGLTYNIYYIVVRGADRNVNYGNYGVSITFAPTDDFADAGEFPSAGSIAIDTGTGNGQIDGKTEILIDSDLFIFTAPAGGSATVTVDRRPGTTSGIIPKLTILKLVNGAPVVIGTNTAGTGPFTPAQFSFNVTRGSSYFVQVENTGGVFGEYRVNITSTPIDDHANSGEFSIATVVPLSSTDGNGSVGSVADAVDTPKLNYIGDTDLFTFLTRNSGVSIITVSVLQGNLAPGLTIYDSTGLQIGTVSAGAIGQTVSFTTSTSPNNTRFYVLVSAVGLGGASLTGQYKLVVDGPNPPDGSGGGGGDPGLIDFNNPVIINLDSLTGYGEKSDQIDLAGDRDLFKFTTFASPASILRNIQVQIVTPNGSTLDASVIVLNAPNENAVVASDSGGYPGAEADVNFTDGGLHSYYVIVKGAGNGVGTYSVRVLAEPEKHTVFFPEGYSSASIHEFVSIGNPSVTNTATYSVILRYETGAIGGIIASGSIAPGSRGGVTLSDGANGVLAGVRSDTPYSIIIESNIEVAATLAHYDFGSSIGDAFVNTTSDTWTFSRVERVPGSVFDFVVYYNPNNFDVDVTLTAYASGQAPVSLTQTVGANRRLGFSVNDIPQFPTGVFGAVLTSKAKNAGDQSSFRGVVASLSHYNQTFGTGFAEMGDIGLGDTTGAINSLTNGSNVTGEVVFFNPGTAPAVVNVVGTYIRTPALPQVVRTINLAPKQVLVLSGTQLNLVADQPIGLAFTSNVPVSVLASETQSGDANATSTAFRAGTGYVFGDAFINTAAAGQLYFETLNFHNPTATDSTVDVRLLFSNSDVVTVSVTIPSHGFSELKLHELPQIITDRPGLNFFSIQVTGALPFTASLTHYDLYLGGGWTTSGAVYGLTNPISRIS